MLGLDLGQGMLEDVDATSQGGNGPGVRCFLGVFTPVMRNSHNVIVVAVTRDMSRVTDT